MAGPNHRPRAYPRLSPITASGTTTPTSAAPPHSEVTPVAARRTTASPGTIRPTNALVSSSIPSPANNVRSPGSRDWMASSSHVITSFSMGSSNRWGEWARPPHLQDARHARGAHPPSGQSRIRPADDRAGPAVAYRGERAVAWSAGGAEVGYPGGSEEPTAELQ